MEGLVYISIELKHNPSRLKHLLTDDFHLINALTLHVCHLSFAFFCTTVACCNQ